MEVFFFYKYSQIGGKHRIHMSKTANADVSIGATCE